MGYVSKFDGTKKCRRSQKNYRKQLDSRADKGHFRIKTDKIKEGKYMGAQAYLETIQMNQEIMALQKENPVDMESVDSVNARVMDYFEIMKKYKNKPTVAGLSLSLGIDRSQLGSIMSGKSGTKRYTEEVRELLHQVYTMYESMWETYMLEGFVNPNAGIFIAKNQFGYKDVVEQNIVADVQPRISAENIKAKYIGADNELPADHKEDGEDEQN